MKKPVLLGKCSNGFDETPWEDKLIRYDSMLMVVKHPSITSNHQLEIHKRVELVGFKHSIKY